MSAHLPLSLPVAAPKSQNEALDHRCEADHALLRRCRKTCVIDFIRFIDDPAIAVTDFPGRKRLGAISTIQDLKHADLLALPPEVRKRKLQAVEFSLDIYPSGHRKGQSLTPEQRLEIVGELVDLLHRRITPWTSPYVGNRFSIHTGEDGWSIPILGDTDFKKGIADKRLLRKEWALLDLAIPRPRLVNGRARNAMAYYGHRIKPTVEPGYLCAQRPRAQLKLYGKITDDDASLPPELWLCRLEVALNGSALRERFGIVTVEDLISVGLKKIADAYFDPQTATRVLLARPRRFHGGVMQGWAQRRLEAMQEATYQKAVALGPVAVTDQSQAVKYRRASALRRVLMQAVHDYARKPKQGCRIASPKALE